MKRQAQEGLRTIFTNWKILLKQNGPDHEEIKFGGLPGEGGVLMKLKYLVMSVAMILLLITPAWAGPNSDLYHAACNGDLQGAREALAQGASINGWVGSGFLGIKRKFIPLMCASKYGHLTIARFLIKHGANVNERAGDAPWAYTPLVLAAENGHTDIVRLLIEHGANVVLHNGDTVANHGGVSNYPEIVALIHNAANIRAEWLEKEKIRMAEQARIENLEKLNTKLDAVADDLKQLFNTAPESPQSSSMPESYRKEMVIGLANVRDAKTQDDYLRALRHFDKAARIVPRAPAPYEALGHISETVGAYAAAVEFFNLYLLADPNASDARMIKDRLYILEDKAKRQQ